MLNVSTTYKEQMNNNLRTWIPRMTIDGLEVDGEINPGMTINKGSCGTEQFAIGTLYIPYITATITGCTTKLEDKELLLEMGLKLPDGTVEYHPIGFFKVGTPVTDKFATTIEAYGRLMSKCGGLYVSDLTWPTSVESVLTEISQATGVRINVKGFSTSSLIEEPITGLQYREVLQIIAGLLGGYCTEDSTGNIVIAKYELTESVSIDTDFCYSYPTKNDKDYEVTGLEIIVTADSVDEEGNTTAGITYSAGLPNVKASNQYMTEELFNQCASSVLGLTYKPASVQFLGDIQMEPWDYMEVVDDDEVLNVPCMNIMHVWDGGLVTTITAPGASATETESAFAGPVTTLVERLYQELITAKEIIAQKVSTKYLEANYATVDEISGKLAEFGYITADEINAKLAEFGYVKTDEIDAVKATINHLNTKVLYAEDAKLEYATINSLNAETAKITGLLANYATIARLESVDAKFGSLDAKYATLDLANVKAGSITSAMIGTGVVGTAQIADGSITEAKIVDLTANKITAGTLSVERLEIRGSENSLVYALNNITGALQAKNVNTINGEIMTPRSITADKIVAKAITANEIAARAITANEILAGTLTANEIASKAITANEIAAGTITANEIAAGTITANKLNVTTLSAITASLGTVTAGVLQSPNFAMSNYSVDANGETSGTVVSGLKIDLNNKAYYTPHITIKDNYVHLNGYITIGTRSARTNSSQVDADIGPYSFTQGKDLYSCGTASFVHGINNREELQGLGSAPMLANHIEGIDNRIQNGAETGTKASHVGGIGNHCKASAQMVIGKYNAIDYTASYENPYGAYAFIVGNGTSSERSNACTLDWNGNAWLAGGLSLKQNITYALASRAGMPFYVWNGDVNGMGVRIGDGGVVVIGAGESASNLISNMGLAASTEQLYLASDDNIYFYTNCQTITSKVNTLTLTSAGATVNGELVVGNGKDFHLRAASGVDSGDIVFENNSGGEVGRLWYANNKLLWRYSPDGLTAREVLHSGNFNNIIKTYTWSKSITVPGTGAYTFQMGAVQTYSGYTFLGYLNQNSGYGDQWLISYGTYGGNVVAMVYSKYGASLTQTVSCTGVWIRNSYSA